MEKSMQKDRKHDRKCDKSTRDFTDTTRVFIKKSQCEVLACASHYDFGDASHLKSEKSAA